MPFISISQVPSGLDQDLTYYLDNLSTEINLALGAANQLPRFDVMPEKFSVGKIYYFNREILPDITEEGYWGYKSTGWVQMERGPEP